MLDDVWLNIVCQKGWIVFSHDQKFHTLEPEAMAIKQHNGMCFYLPGANDTTWVKLGYLVKAQSRIEKMIDTIAPPFIYSVYPNLKLKRIPLP